MEIELYIGKNKGKMEMRLYAGKHHKNQAKDNFD